MITVAVIIILAVIVIIESVYILWMNKNRFEERKLKETVDFFRGLWSKFVIYVIATSVIGLFVASFALDKVITLSTMNEWVSLVLGLVALIIGIISLFLSFYNLDQAYISQKENMDVMRNVEKAINQNLDDLKKSMNNRFDGLVDNSAANKNVRKEKKQLSGHVYDSKIENLIKKEE